MFTRVAPQRAGHTDGSIVQVGGRYSIHYLTSDTVAELEADFGETTGIYPDTLTASRRDGTAIVLTNEMRSEFLSRIAEGLDCLGVRFEMCSGRPQPTSTGPS